MKNEYNIAILLTCYNRREKTVNAIGSIVDALRVNGLSPNVNFEFFLTDDGCTDGTSEYVSDKFSDIAINIIKADGNAFWAGGMRLAWQAAIDAGAPWDFFLLINDDTQFKLNCFEDLFSTHEYAVKTYGKSGVYTGFISSVSDESLITYGAKVYSNSVLSKAVSLKPNGVPQECTMTNANIMMVSKEVVASLGILDDIFIHAAADLDYGIKAAKAGFPVLTTSSVCGYCEFDHDNADVEQKKVMGMTLKQRKAYLNRPNIKQYHDSLVFYWRYSKVKWAIFGLSYYLNLYFPSLYYKLYRRRGH